MKFKTSLSLMVAVVLGLVTTYAGLDLVSKTRARQAPGAKVVVAARDLEVGYVVTEADLAIVEVPPAMLPEKSIRDPKLAAGRTVLTTVIKNYPMLDAQLSAPGAGGGVQAMIPSGMRAVTVDVSDSSSVGGLLIPGCHVDVISTLKKGDGIIARTVVENVKVQFVQRGRTSGSSRSQAAAAAASGSPDGAGPVKTVTLIVSPAQAMSIELAQISGKPRLVMRGSADTSSSKDLSVSQNQLLGLPDDPPAPPPVVPEPIVQKPEPPSVPDKVFENPEPIDPLANKREVQIIRGGGTKVEKVYYDEEGKPKELPPGETTPQEGNGAVPASAGNGTGNGSKAAGESSRNASGASPEVPPRTEASLENYAR